MKAHRTDLVSFAFGLVFLALSGWWLLAQLLGLALPAVGWFLASALILIGVFGLVGALRSGRSPQAEATAEAAEAAAPVSGATAPVSGAEAPVSGAAVPTSGAALPVWEAERSTSDAPPSATTPEAPTAEVIHPAWLAHPPSEPQTSPIPGQPDDRHEEPTVGLGNGPAPVEGDEPTRLDHPIEAVGDPAGDEREGRSGKA
ncbi:hypothetical protein GCM10028790_23420 [Micromonospora taraxaci]|uniref:Uncharacterized protein n=1 Tax=Micromonospora taraxaci TaxID=1316803 RepID=A0A561VVY6_9ACTN|nr:hypothetical protein FHU34_111109 [Micromonospora taraxaci]